MPLQMNVTGIVVMALMIEFIARPIYCFCKIIGSSLPIETMGFEMSAGADGIEFRRLEPSESACGATFRRMRNFTKALAFVKIPFLTSPSHQPFYHSPFTIPDFNLHRHTAQCVGGA